MTGDSAAAGTMVFESRRKAREDAPHLRRPERSGLESLDAGPHAAQTLTPPSRQVLATEYREGASRPPSVAPLRRPERADSITGRGASL